MPDLRVSPQSVTLTAGQIQKFEALDTSGQTVQNVTWSIQPTEKAGKIESPGIYTAPLWIFRHKKAVIVAQQAGGAQATAEVELSPLPFWTNFLGAYLLLSFLLLLALLVWNWDWLCPTCKPGKVRVSPPVVTLMPSQSQTFTANLPVTWNKNAQMTASGLYTAPAQVPASGRAQVAATAQEDLEKDGMAEVLISQVGGLSLQPARAVVSSGGSVDLTAVLTSPQPPKPAAPAVPAEGGNQAPPAPDASSPITVTWMAPEIGTLTSLTAGGPVARFSVPAKAVDRPTPVMILARTSETPPRIAGAWVTVQPADSLIGVCGDGYDYNAAKLLLLLAIMGALGGLIHGISSFTTYVGNREFLTSWVWWYAFKPFLAGLVALVVFLVFRAGFGVGDFSLGTADCLKAGAVAAMIGLFAEQATVKLKDIFETIFTPRNDPRRDEAGKVKPKGPTLKSLEPPSVTEGQNVQKLTINGADFASECQVKIGNAALRKPSSVTATSVVVSLEPDDIKTKGDVAVIVYNKPPDGDPSNTLALKVEPKVS
jgi:hypothetical protein